MNNSCVHPTAHGMTLIEVMMAMVIATLISAAAFSSLQVGSKAYATAAIRGQAQSSARKVVDELSRTLLDSCMTTMVEPASSMRMPYGSKSITFRKAVGYLPATGTNTTGTISYGPVNKMVLEGGKVVLYENVQTTGTSQAQGGSSQAVSAETSRELAEGISELLEGEDPNGVDDNGNGLVDEPGLCFVLDPGNENNLIIFITIERKHGDEVHQTTVSSTVQMRNR